MPLSLVSFNYKHTPLALRELLNIPSARLPALLHEVRQACALDELMMLSTCNRVEFYFSAAEGEQASQAILAWMKKGFSGWEEDMERCGVILHDQPAVIHLFRVACSLESMVIGEPQILGQVKESFQIARQHRMVGPYLTGLMQKVFQAAKRVRTETGIARFPVSVSYMAVELAGKIFERLDDKTVLVIGAGEMAELVVAHLKRKGVRKLMITNRTFSNAVALAERVQGSAVRFEQMADHLAASDIVIGSTGAQGHVVDKEMARQATKSRKGNPIFFIDIAVPRDISPEVGSLSNVYCYDIDALQNAASANLKERESESEKAQAIIDEEVRAVQHAGNARLAVPVIRALREQFNETGNLELEKTFKRLGHLSEAEREAMRGLVRSVTNKLLHRPSTRLKEMEADGDGSLFSEALVGLFGLNPDAMDTPDAPLGPGNAGEAQREDPVLENVVQLRIPGKS
ncbi:MAG: glutamyl-tRNA reductase [bacterium]